MKLWLALCILAASATAANAAFVATAITGLASALGVGAAASAALGGWLAKTLISVALSQLSMMLKGKPRPPGISTDTTTTGGTTPQKFIMGLYASAGQMVAPPNSYGSVGKTPRAFLVYPIALSVVAGCTLQRVIIDDAYVTLAASGATWGQPVTGDLAGFLNVDFRNGSQTLVHSDMLAAFAADPDRPWLSDMVGPDTSYAVLRFKYNRERFNGLPSARFEVLGIPLYDPRFDTTVGGSGPQRWASRSTWAQSTNPMVMIYNILRGIDVGAGMIWGGECDAEDLPLASWFATMNECDLAVPSEGGGTETQYRAGIEVALEDEPAAVIEELLKTCAGQIVEVGGIWYPRCGGPAMPSYFLTDDDILISREQEFVPFPSITETFNGITSSYPEPTSLWEAKDAPPRYSPTWEAEDGNRRLVADLPLSACPYPSQVQRLMAQYIADHRRMRRHQFVLPPEAAVLLPLETVGYTSARFGYTGKIFEITSLTDGLTNLRQAVSLRERDGGDFAWNSGDYVATSLPGTATTAPAAQGVPGWDATAEIILDAAGAARRSAIRLHWDADAADDATGLHWEARVAGAATAQLSGTHAAISDGSVAVRDGIIPSTAYETRGHFIVNRATVWSSWAAVTSPAINLNQVDLTIGAVSCTQILRSAGGGVSVTDDGTGGTADIIPGAVSFAAGTFSNLIKADGTVIVGTQVPVNPILVDGIIRVACASTGYARLKLRLQYFITSWLGINEQFFLALDPSLVGQQHDVKFGLLIDQSVGATAALWTGLRLSATTEGFTPHTGATIQVWDCTAIVQQVNR